MASVSGGCAAPTLIASRLIQEATLWANAAERGIAKLAYFRSVDAVVTALNVRTSHYVGLWLADG
jgi:hypothetical protein